MANVDENLCEDIVKMCCTLHNFLRARDGYENTLTAERLFDLEPYNQVPTKKANKLRDKFAEYFTREESALPYLMEQRYISGPN